jgi:hypothetical protein
MPRRSMRLAAKDAMRFARENGRYRSLSSESDPELPADDLYAAAPVVKPEPQKEDIERNRIIGFLADCKCKFCVSETKGNHEANCEWCRTHPEWRLISHNLTILMENMEKLRTKAAKVSGALAVMSYINDNVIDFAKAHEKFKQTVIQKCKEFVADCADKTLLRLVCADVIYKLS